MGIHDHETLKLGLQPHDKSAEQLLALDWAAGQPPAYAPRRDNLLHVRIGLDANDRFGDCGPTSCDNHRRITKLSLTGVEVDAGLDEVFDLYRRSGNPHFDPATGADDNGVSMPVLLGALRSGGLGGEKIVAYARLRDTSDASLFAAIDYFGAVLLAVSLQTAQQTQSEGPNPIWDYSSSPDWGGHAVVAAAYDAEAGFVDVGSWGMRVRTTSAFRAKQLDEVWVPIWTDTIGDHRFQEAVDLPTLASLFKDLTGGELPIPTPPAPAPPTPEPDPAPVTPVPVPEPPKPQPGLVLNIRDPRVKERVEANANRHGMSPDDYVEAHLQRYYDLVDSQQIGDF